MTSYIGQHHISDLIRPDRNSQFCPLIINFEVKVPWLTNYSCSYSLPLANKSIKVRFITSTLKLKEPEQVSIFRMLQEFLVSV